MEEAGELQRAVNRSFSGVRKQLRFFSLNTEARKAPSAGLLYGDWREWTGELLRFPARPQQQRGHEESEDKDGQYAGQDHLHQPTGICRK